MPWLLLRRALVRSFVTVCNGRSRSTDPRIVPILVAAAILFALSASFAQSPPPKFIETAQGKIFVPITTGVLGQRDSVALAEIANHLTAVGDAPWIGMQGTGKIIYDLEGPTSYDATLANLGDYAFRLDTRTEKGETSVRIHRFLGRIQGDDGKVTKIPIEMAASGIFPFERARLEQIPKSRASLIDHGPATLGGTELHRITAEFEIIGFNPATKSRPTIAIDYYFDPNSHLLTMTVASVPMPDTGGRKFLSVVNYSDYRKVGASLVPFRYTETIEGQPYRTLQLSDVQLSPALTSTNFEF